MVLSSLQPAGDSSGLKKLTIKYEKYFKDDFFGSVEALFNPKEFLISSSLKWKTKGGEAVGEETVLKQKFESRVPKTISVDLFFDSYEQRDTGLFAAIPSINPFPTPDATDVREYTNPLLALATINEELHRPPVCKLSWGDFEDIFTGVLTKLDQKFTMFMPSGMPVRATVSCSFMESDMVVLELHSADITKTVQVMPQDTLHSIAIRQYGDASQWRRIARANQIMNPRLLTPGMRLIIPTLT
ncbi:MAG: LysM peptidoglycan-binding domain-containing protein [Aestuariibacter sp.]|nr:LysM peptidoglycan-binding domain-containing protein [Aestuariibacter sp.]